MVNSGCTIKVPGKLMIAGEYAVLERGHKAVVVAVNRYVTATIKPALVNELSLPQLGLEGITWIYDEKGIEYYLKVDRLSFVRNAMITAFDYLKEKGIKPHSFQLQITSDLNDPMTGKKYGLGSSAAIVVAVIASILSFHGELKDCVPNEEGIFYKDETLAKAGGFSKNDTFMRLFKLSAIAHVKTQGNGSGADIAAVVYGGWIKYSTFRAKWLLAELAKDSNITKLLERPWPDLMIGKLSPPKELKLLVGWTKESVGTAPMVKKIEAFQDKNMEYYQEFLAESYACVSALIDAFDKDEIKKAIEAINKNRMALLDLGERAGVTIETKRIKTLCSIADKYGRGKSSGAGGGDCGIAFTHDEENFKSLWLEWKKAEILPLDLSVAPKGCTVLRIESMEGETNDRIYY